MSEFPIGPNPCEVCGEDYGQHKDGCRRAPMGDKAIQRCERCDGKYNPQGPYSPPGWCPTCWDAALIELNKHGKVIKASKHEEEQKDAEIELLRAGIWEIQETADQWHQAVWQRSTLELALLGIRDKCVELLKGGGDETV